MKINVPENSDQRGIKYMKEALKQARRAFERGEVPVGAVVVQKRLLIDPNHNKIIEDRGQDRIIGRGYNKKETRTIATRHAEIEAIEKACKKTSNWRLTGCEIYATLEPCMMCLGAILEARIDRVIFAAPDFRMGFLKYFKDHNPPYAYDVDFTGGVLAEESSRLMKEFFRMRRGG